MKMPVKRISTHLIVAFTILTVSSPALASSMMSEPRDASGREEASTEGVRIGLETPDERAPVLSTGEVLLASIRQMIRGDGASSRLMPYCGTSSVVADAE